MSHTGIGRDWPTRSNNVTDSSKVSIIVHRPGVCFIDHLLSELALFIRQVVFFVKFRTGDRYIMLDMSVLDTEM